MDGVLIAYNNPVHRVYQCQTSTCEPYHLNERVLLEIVVGGKNYSISTSRFPALKYIDDDENELGECLDLVTCSHCGCLTLALDEPPLQMPTQDSVLTQVDQVDKLIQ